MICPNCGSGILDWDILDTYVDSDYVEECLGRCPNCHKKFRWENIYVFSNTNIIEEFPEGE